MPASAGGFLPSRARQRALRRTVARCGRVLVATTILTTALVGAVFTPWLWMLVYAPTLGLLFGGTAALADPDFPRDPASRRLVVHAAATGVLLLPFGAALPALGSLGGVAVLVLLVAGPLVAADRLTEDEVDVRDVAGLRSVLPRLPTAALVETWSGTEELLRSPRHRDLATEVRGLVLDELTRRDPGGVAAWLAVGGTSPAPHIRSDRDLAG
ncbi:hypothetical protein [Blastococcus sp. VKM Ac-2987]|uniref:hypothetical protein n=1 Tax=Blastococcus sp. VKM Ac-2987 TaxID=3004141 RepID=UPI0022AB98FE|nr:hypothetical protein [Blastococcus sp. VKM Ac-2987]MCZ2857111.1 hypothetical protein [Blastococcus sp. VKM Ac-2987]